MLSCGPVGTNLKLKCEGTKVSSAGGVLNCYMNPRPIFVKEGVSCPWAVGDVPSFKHCI